MSLLLLIASFFLAEVLEAREAPTTSLAYSGNARGAIRYKEKKDSFSPTVVNVRFDVPYNDFYFNGGRIDLLMGDVKASSLAVALTAGLRKDFAWGLGVYALGLLGIHTSSGAISQWIHDELTASDTRVRNASTYPMTGGVGVSYGGGFGVSYQLDKWWSIYASQGFTSYETMQKFNITTMDERFALIEDDVKVIYRYRLVTSPFLLGVRTFLF